MIIGRIISKEITDLAHRCHANEMKANIELFSSGSFRRIVKSAATLRSLGPIEQDAAWGDQLEED
jgi:hypothetical protein